MVKSNETMIVIPTFNELENAPIIYDSILALRLDVELLFIDDNSPDGTGKLLDKLAKQDSRVKVIHRQSKLGIGSAHKTGIKYAYEKGIRKIITMDCDFSHPPKYLPSFLENSEDYDVVIGSRYIQSDSLAEWNYFRKFLTKLGHFCTATLLKMPHDATGAYRLYNLEKVPYRIFEMVKSDSYSFLFESLFLLSINGFRIKEIPIVLPKRTYGHSKMKLNDIMRSVVKLVDLIWRSKASQKLLLPRGIQRKK